MTMDFLYRFINSLDQGEIRYCREQLKRDNRPMAKGRLTLFEALASMYPYSPEKEKNAVVGTPMAKHFAVNKNRLYEELLRLVKECHRLRKAANDPRERLDEGRLLLELGLFEDAREVVLKGIEKAVALEELLMEVSLRDLLREILKNLPRNEHRQLITDNEYRLEMASRKLTRLIAYTQINDRMFDYHRKFRISDSKNVSEGIQELMERPEMQSINQADSLPSQIRFLYATSLHQLSEKKFTEALDTKKSIVRLWESNPARMQMQLQHYRGAIANLLGVMAMMGEVSEAPDYLQKMESMKPLGRRDEIAQFSDVELQYSLYYMNIGALDDALKREPIIEKGLSRYGKQLPASRMLTFLYNLGITHLICDNPRKALVYFDRIRQLGILDSRQDIQGIARLLRLLLLAEKDSGTFGHFLRNSQKFFKEKDRQYQLEELVYRWLPEHHKLVDKDVRQQSFQVLATELAPLVKLRILGAEEMLLWATAKSRNVPVRKVFEEKLKATASAEN